MTTLKIISLLLIFTCAIANAQVFQRTGPDGKVYFSDQPGPDATKVDVAPAQSIKLAPLPEQSNTGQNKDKAQQETAPGYTRFSIVSPTAEEGVRANDGTVTVNLSLQPELQSGHSIKLSISGEDGDAVKTGSGPSIELNNLSRGRHTVEARVVDDKGKTLIKTKSVSFFVLRTAGG